MVFFCGCEKEILERNAEFAFEKQQHMLVMQSITFSVQCMNVWRCSYKPQRLHNLQLVKHTTR